MRYAEECRRKNRRRTQKKKVRRRIFLRRELGVSNRNQPKRKISSAELTTSCGVDYLTVDPLDWARAEIRKRWNVGRITGARWRNVYSDPTAVSLNIVYPAAWRGAWGGMRKFLFTFRSAGLAGQSPDTPPGAVYCTLLTVHSMHFIQRGWEAALGAYGGGCTLQTCKVGSSEFYKLLLRLL
jgi:hypothetical protein